MSADAERLAHLLDMVGAQKHLFDHWMNQLRIGDFQYGYGVLRDAYDAFDPMGVLAEINDLDWGDYDDAEQGWTIDGEALFLPVAVVRTCLGCGAGVPDFRLMEFSHAMGELADSVTSHLDFANVIDHAIRIGQMRRTRLADVLDREERRRWPSIGSRDPYYDRYDDRFAEMITGPRKIIRRGLG